MPFDEARYLVRAYSSWMATYNNECKQFKPLSPWGATPSGAESFSIRSW